MVSLSVCLDGCPGRDDTITGGRRFGMPGDTRRTGLRCALLMIFAGEKGMLVDKLELFKTKLLFSSVQKFTLLVGVGFDVFSTLADTVLIEALVRLSLDVGSPGDDVIWFVSLIALHRLFRSPE